MSETTNAADANPAAERSTPRIAHLTLNDSFVERLDADQLRGYLEAIVAVSRQGDSDEETIAADLRQRMDAAGVVLPDESYRNLARQVHGGVDVAISTDSGRVLYGDPNLDTQTHEPDVRGSDDPESADRPFYS